MNRARLSLIIGVSGVAPSETEAARRWGQYLEWPMLGVVLLILVEWYLAAKGMSSPRLSRIVDYIVWFSFLGETLLLTYLVQDKWLYLRSNWLNLVIIVAGIPVLWGNFDYYQYVGVLRSLRLLVAVQIFINLSGTLRSLLARNHLGTTLLISAVFIVIAGILAAGIDSGIETPWDGIWWAWVTVTTVGYGDVVPVTGPGKILGAILILLGIGLFSLLTASFSVFFISQSEDQVGEEIAEELETTEYQMLQRLEKIEQRLDSLEQLIRDSTKSQ